MLLDTLQSTEKDVVVLFTAPTWCGPCRRFEPHWSKAVETVGDKVVFVKVDMGESPEDTGEHWASEHFDILSVPTVKMFDGESVDYYHDINARAVIPFLKEIGYG